MSDRPRTAIGKSGREVWNERFGIAIPTRLGDGSYRPKTLAQSATTVILFFHSRVVATRESSFDNGGAQVPPTGQGSSDRLIVKSSDDSTIRRYDDTTDLGQNPAAKVEGLKG